MGTRHMTGVIQNGEYKVGQYGQWDGYPSGQGVNVLAFLKQVDMPRFEKNVAKCSWITEEEISRRLSSIGINPEAQFITMQEGDSFKEHWPEMSRDTGSNILFLIEKADDGLMLNNAVSFHEQCNGGFGCEYAYIIDLDKHELIVEASYKVVKRYPLDDLPDEITFLKDLNDYNE